MTQSDQQLPGSQGEKRLQKELGTDDRARRFYENAVSDQLTDRMISYVTERSTAFVGSTSGAVSSVRVRHYEDLITVHDRGSIGWREPENSTFARRARGAEHGTLMAVDWEDTTVGLHVNGELSTEQTADGVMCHLAIEEAYIHCAKHLPRLDLVADEVPPGTAAALPTGTFDELTPEILDFLSYRIFFMLGTADANGETDISPRFGPQGFVQSVREGVCLAYPEYRGNGVHASLGNMLETERAQMTFVDWWCSGNVVSVEGPIKLFEGETPPGNAVDLTGLDRTKVWVALQPERVKVTNETLPRYHIEEYDPAWGTDDKELKKSGFFARETE